MLITLAQELGKLPNKLSIEGHTDSKPYATSGNYSNWELSTDRANAARRIVQANGIEPDQITQVRGFADQRLRKLEDPLDPSNRRISLIVQYIVKNSDAAQEGKPSAEAGGGKKGEEKSAEEKKSEESKSGATKSTENKSSKIESDEKNPSQKKPDAGKEVPAKKNDAPSEPHPRYS